MDECADGTHICHLGPVICTHAVGSFTCSFTSGYARNGTLCTAIDECANGTCNCHPCHVTYDNNMGSFTCYTRLYQEWNTVY